MSAESNENAYRRLNEEAFNQGKVAVIDEMLSADFTEHEKLPAGLPAGRAGVKALIGFLHTGFPDIKHTVEDITVDGDKVWARLTVSATNTGPLMGQPPTGKHVTWDVIDVVGFAGGKIVEHWGVTDVFGMMVQLGAIPVPGQPAEVGR